MVRSTSHVQLLTTRTVPQSMSLNEISFVDLPSCSVSFFSAPCTGRLPAHLEIHASGGDSKVYISQHSDHPSPSNHEKSSLVFHDEPLVISLPATGSKPLSFAFHASSFATRLKLRVRIGKFLEITSTHTAKMKSLPRMSTCSGPG